MIENKEVMARNIRHYMQIKNVSAAEICKELGFRQNTFSCWINAKYYPRIDKIEQMANYFGISKSALVEESVDDFDLSDLERKMIIEFRSSDAVTRDAIKRLLSYSKRSQS